MIGLTVAMLLRAKAFLEAQTRCAVDRPLVWSCPNPSGIWFNLGTRRTSFSMGVVKDDDATITWDSAAMQRGDPWGPECRPGGIIHGEPMACRDEAQLVRIYADDPA